MSHVIFIVDIFEYFSKRNNTIQHKIDKIKYLINVFKNSFVIDFNLSRTVGTRESFVLAHRTSYNKVHVFYFFKYIYL